MHDTTVHLAQALLGAELRFNGCGGLIVETEAYLGVADQAAHAYQGRQTARNQALWAAPGTVYVYQMRQYCLLNIHVQTQPDCILIRALQPTCGVATMRARRGQTGVAVANGPGKLCQALAITLAQNHSHLDDGPLTLTLARKRPARILSGPRIGIPNRGAATAWPLRFWVADNPHVSGIARKNTNLDQKGWQ